MEVSNASYSDTKMRVVVGVSCCLSIFGSLLIILSYVLFKETRIIVRTILLHVSLMDLGVAVATLICLSSDLDRFYVEMPSNVVKSCKIQGFFAVYCTLASFLWTITFAALLATGSSDYPWFGCKSIACFWVVSIVVCYSLPLLVSLWLVLTGKLGCPPLHSYSLRLRMDIDEEYGNTNIFSVVFGYDLWVYLTMVILPILYLSAAIGSHDYYWLMSKYKFFIIPAVFMLLHIWSVIQGILYDYIQLDVDVSPHLSLALFYLSGIGENMQGFSNGLIFVIFDRRIRVRFIRCIYRLSCSPMKKLYDSLKDPDTKCNCVRFIKCIRGCIFHCICPIRFNIKSCFRFICCIVSCILCCCLRKRRGTNHHDNNVSISSDDDNEILDDSYRSLYSGMQASVIHADRQKTFNESEKEVSLVFMDLSQSYGSISDEQELCK